MTSNSELVTAIRNGQFALVEKIVLKLKEQGVKDFSNELKLAQNLNKVRGGAFNKVVDVILKA